MVGEFFVVYQTDGFKLRIDYKFSKLLQYKHHLIGMSKKQMTLVYYYVPQDKDDPDCPNVFGVPFNKATLKLSHIYQSFPLKGTYLFRFKYLAEAQIVWLDLPDVDAKLPTFKDKVYVKATRVSWEDSKLHSNYKQKPNIKQEQIINTKAESVNFFDSPNKQKKAEQKRYMQSNANNNHVDLMNQNKMAPQSQSNQNNLLSGLDINYLPSTSAAGINLLGQYPSSNTPKKPQINLMTGFDTHSNNGDLI